MTNQMFTEEDLEIVRKSIIKDDGHVKDDILDKIAELRKFEWIQEMATRSIISDLMHINERRDIIEVRMADLITAMYLGFLIGRNQASANALEKLING